MSITLPTADLASLAVGQSGSISLAAISGGGGIPFQENHRATIRLHNDSGAGLRITLPRSGQQFNLPAGGWADCYPAQGEIAIQYTVIYLLPNPPVSLLLATYYFPGELVPPMTLLGNSPVGIGGTVTTSSVQTLSNEGNAANTLVIDIGDSALAQLIKIYASGQTIWKVDQAGVAHQVLAIQITGNPLQLGQSGDTTEILGQALIDQLLTAGAGITVTAGGITITGKASLDGGAITTDGSGDIIINGSVTTPATLTQSQTGHTGLSVAGTSSLDNGALTTDGSGNISKSGGKFGVAAAGDVLDGSGYDTFVKARGSSNVVHIQENGADIAQFYGVNNAASLSGKAGTLILAGDLKLGNNGLTNNLYLADGSRIATLHMLAASGSGTFNHGCPKQPQAWFICPNTTGSYTIGASANATQITVNIGGNQGVSWVGAAMTYN